MKKFTFREVENVFIQEPLEEPDVVFVGEEGVKYACPCGCKREVFLRRRKGKKEKYPSWDIDSSSASISPSIRELMGCKSHYHIKKGKVEWCSDTGK